MKRLLKWTIKTLIEAAIETVWGTIGAVALLVLLAKTYEFIERRTKKNK